MTEKIIFVGVIASPNSLTNLSIFSGYLTVKNGKITEIGTEEEFTERRNFLLNSGFHEVVLNESQFLLPGLVDCHLHAPQFPNIGLGLDLPLLEWLDKYTFPLESHYKNLEFAQTVYNQVVPRLIISGTTTACYFGSIHLEGTLELVKSVVKYQQRALVGKVSMNVKNDAGYYNETNKELGDVETFIKQVRGCNNDLVAPIITPRFAISCNKELMIGLSKLSEQYGCRIQSHISENLKEIQQVLKDNPDCKSYADVYDKCGILNNRCIMAHAVHLSDEEITLMERIGVAVAHCPASNTRLLSGLCPVRKLLENNITVGLGTDVAGGDSASILDAMRRCMDVSTHLALQGAKADPINWKEALYLATLGGAKALNLDEKIGNFNVGKEFDALLVDMHPLNGPIDRYQYSVEQTVEERATSLVQRFVYLGDDRNIIQVYVKGNKVKYCS